SGAGRAGVGPVALGRSGKRRPRAVHTPDDAGSDRRRRRSDGGHVAAQGQPRATVREARPRATSTSVTDWSEGQSLDAPFRTMRGSRGRTVTRSCVPLGCVQGTVPRTCLTGQERVDGWVAAAAARPHLAPRALVRVLVRPEADEAGAVPEAIALELVVAHLDDELGPNRVPVQLLAARPSALAA